MINGIHEPPRMTVGIDVPPPRERFIADDHAGLLREPR